MTYDIREHLAVLTPSKGSKTKYHCPVCNGDDLDIKPSDGQYNCFSNKCELKDIRAVIDKREGKPEWKPEQKWEKPTRPKSQKDYFYLDRNGGTLAKVTRADDGSGGKKFYQSHWDGSKWLKGNPDEVKKLIPIYRYAEVQQAIERNELIFTVEGESTADLLWELGIAATTTIGGSGGYSSYGVYLEDLKGARLVLAPDRDSNGLKYIGNIERDFHSQIEGYYLAGTVGLWKKPDGGMDIGDDIRDHQVTKEQILKKVISPGEYREAIAPKPKVEKQKAEKQKAEKQKAEKQKALSALEMSKKVFRDLFENVIRFDASVKQYWRYDGRGKWVTCSNEYIFREVRKYLEKTIATFSPSYVRNVIEFAIGEILHEGWTEMSSLQYMPFENGVLEMKTKQLLPHSPDYGFTWQLPRPYLAIEAEWGNISKFLDTFTSGNQQLKDIAIAFCQAALIGRADLQKFLYLFGSGANGKGAFMGLLSMLVGKENTHSTTIAELNESRFESANLMNKRLVLMTDEDKRIGGLSVFKSATGGDPIRYERKGKDASNFIFKGMFVVAANYPTFVGDSSYAIKRRKLDFPCLSRVDEKDRRDLTPEFEAELTAFTTYLLSLSDESVTAIIRGAESVAAVKELNWEMTKREDSIAAFFDEKLIIDPKGSIGCGALYSLYKSYCDDSGLKTKSINNFTPSLLELCNDSLGHSIAKKKASGNNVIVGIRLREAWEFEDDTSVNTDENSSSLLKNNQNSLIKLERYPCPPLSLQDNGLKYPLGYPQVSTGIHTTKPDKTPKVGDRVRIPVCNKYGRIERIETQEGKKGLYARVILDDKSEKLVFPECLEVVTPFMATSSIDELEAN